MSIVLKKYLKYLLIGVFIIFTYLFISFYVSKETPLYNCDLVEQNLFYYDYGQLLIQDFVQFVKNFLHDLCYYNRNPFLILFLLPFHFLIKHQRIGFLFAVSLVYMLPVMLMLYHIFKTYVLKEENKNYLFSLMILSSIFLFPSIWYPMLRGIPDICGIVPILLCFILYFKYDLNKKVSFKLLLLMSILLYCAFLMRRWYSIVIVTFFLSMIFENLILSINGLLKTVSSKTEYIKNEIKKYLYLLKNISIITILGSIYAYIIQNYYVRNMYINESFERNLYNIDFNQLNIITIEHLGVIVLAIAIYGAIANYKNHIVRFFTLNTLIYVFIFIVLMKNQWLWINHYLYIAVSVALLYSSGLQKIIKYIKNKNIAKNMFIIIVILYNIFNFYTYFLKERPQIIKNILPKTEGYPLIIDGAEQIYEIYNYLKDEYEKDNSIKIASYGYRNHIGYWAFRSIDPNSEFVKNAVLFETNLDDNYWGEDINANYVILFNPLDINIESGYNNVLARTSKMFEENKGIAKNYKIIKEFYVDDELNTKVTIFKRKKLLSKKEIQNYLELFRENFRDYEERFKKFYE